MKAFRVVICVLAATVMTAVAGTQAGAERIVKEQRVAHLEWQQQMLSAQSPTEKALLLQSKPDYEKYGQLMVNEIASSLQQPWAMPYIVWTVREHPTLSAKGVKHLIGYVEQFHKDSALVGEFSLALVGAGEHDQQKATAAGILQKKTQFIKNAHKKGASKVVRGQAALALSSLLARRGDDPQTNRSRLNLIRQAIIDAADAKVGDTTVAEIAREEIYRLSKLSKGALAPDLVGTDSSGRPMRLSDSRGKITLLIFWSSTEQAESVIAFAQKMQETYAGKPVEVIGVNRDTLTHLRQLDAAGKSVGRSFTDPKGKLFAQYRVKHSPVCYVLDKHGAIQYNGAPGSFADFTVSALLAPQK